MCRAWSNRILASFADELKCTFACSSRVYASILPAEFDKLFREEKIRIILNKESDLDCVVQKKIQLELLIMCATGEEGI